jgi:hypothetical protein
MQQDQLNEFKRQAKLWALKNLVGKKVFQKDIGTYVLFTKSGIGHTIYAKTYIEKLEMLYHAVELLENSTLLKIEKDRRGRVDIKAIYKFISEWNFNDKQYLVYIIERETQQGNFYYDHGIIKEKP